MRPLNLARFALCAFAPALLLLAACGSSDSKKVAADDWVDDLCKAAATFESASDKAGDKFTSADLSDTKAAKKAFADSLEDQKDAQDKFRDDFDDIGQPDIKGGDKVVKAFQDTFKEHDKLTDDVGKAVADIDDDKDFAEEFLKIADDHDTPDFRAKLTDLAEDNDDVQDLIDQIDADPDCSSTIFDSPGADETSSGDDGNSSSRPTPAPANSANEKWVSGICTAFNGWVSDLEDANTVLQGKLNNASGSPAQLKQLLLDFLKKGQLETNNLQKEVRALKAPDVKDGAAIQKVFTDTTGKLVGVFDDLVNQANRVNTNSLAQTAADVERLADGIGTAFDDAASGFDRLDDFDAPELEKLFQDRPECVGLGG